MFFSVDKENLLLHIEEYGTSSWEKVAENTGASEEVCQEMFSALSKEADSKERSLKRKIMGTGAYLSQHLCGILFNFYITLICMLLMTDIYTRWRTTTK